MRNKFDKEVEFFSNFSDVFNHVCPKLNLDVTSVFNSFETLLIHYVPNDENVHNFPRARDIKTCMNKHSGDLESYILISRFIKILQTLPLSESAAERIFARMRDIIKEKQTRSQIILIFYVDQIKKEKIV